jgi:hypothetical protein
MNTPFSFFLFGVKTLEKTLVGGPAMFRDHAQIRIIGSKKDTEQAEQLLKTIPDLENLGESKARLAIQKLIEDDNLKASILFDGNSVWNSKPIITNLRKIMVHGTLYNGEKPHYVPIGSMLRFPVVGECILSDYFYSFIHLHCGTSAHYNKQGWVTIYPTVEDLKAFFMKNEYGHRVIDDIPDWETDVKRIVQMIVHELFPLQSYIKSIAQKT